MDKTMKDTPEFKAFQDAINEATRALMGMADIACERHDIHAVYQYMQTVYKFDAMFRTVKRRSENP